jgi:hypothetical protein
MYFIIIEPFGPAQTEQWSNYINWRNVELTSFESIDGILRKSLFDSPENDDEWNYVVNKDFSLHLITDKTFAEKKYSTYSTASLVGIKFENHDENNEFFSGYDITDQHNDVSLLTNWGNDFESVNQNISNNGLIPQFEKTVQVHNELILNHGTDAHVMASRIVSVYPIATKG